MDLSGSLVQIALFSFLSFVAVRHSRLTGNLSHWTIKYIIGAIAAALLAIVIIGDWKNPTDEFCLEDWVLVHAKTITTWATGIIGFLLFASVVYEDRTALRGSKNDWVADWRNPRNKLRRARARVLGEQYDAMTAMLDPDDQAYIREGRLRDAPILNEAAAMADALAGFDVDDLGVAADEVP